MSSRQLEFRKDDWVWDTHLGFPVFLCSLDPWGRMKSFKKRTRVLMNSHTETCSREGRTSRGNWERKQRRHHWRTPGECVAIKIKCKENIKWGKKKCFSWQFPGNYGRAPSGKKGKQGDRVIRVLLFLLCIALCNKTMFDHRASSLDQRPLQKVSPLPTLCMPTTQ